MNFDPVDPTTLVANGVIPPRGVRQQRLQGLVEVHAAAQCPCVLALNPRPIDRLERTKTRAMSILEMHSRLHGRFERHRWLAAAAVATSVFARALNSDRPPQFASNVLCAAGSSFEMSCT